MNHDLRQSAWRLYRKYNMVFGALLLILGIAAIFGATYVFPNSQASTITLGIGTSFIASVIFATLTRYFIEKEFEDLLRETIDKALTESADKILHRAGDIGHAGPPACVRFRKHGSDRIPVRFSRNWLLPRAGGVVIDGL